MQKVTNNGHILVPHKRSPENYIPKSVEAICMKALAVERTKRYQSVTELISEIHAYLNGFAPTAENAGFWLQAKLFIKRNKRIFTVIFIALFILLSSAGYFVFEISTKEKQTSSALKKSIISELETKKALNKLQEEKSTRIEAEKMTSKRFMKQASDFLRDADFPKSLAATEKALNYDSTSPEALRIKARILMALHEFEEAIQTIAFIPKDRYEIMHQNAGLLQKSLGENGEPSVETKMILTRYFNPGKRDEPHTLYQKVLEKNYRSFTGNEKKIYIKKLICSLNNGLMLDDVKVDLTKNSLVINSEKLIKLPYLLGSNLKNVDLSYSGILSTDFAVNFKLQKLNLAHSKIKYFKSSEITGVKNLNISHTRIKGFPRQIAQIENFNIENTPLNDYSRLVNLKKLKSLTIKKGQISEEILALLTCDIIEI